MRLHTKINSLSSYHSLCAIGVSYFVYGEMIDVYSGDPKLNEFIDVGLKFIRSLASITMALPFYKLRIYTKPYREFVDTLNKLQDCGTWCIYIVRDYLVNDKSCEHEHVGCMVQVHACPVLWCTQTLFTHS